ncbi:hypothetical protein [Streptomyces sp. NPDC093261]|uniref:hypothetical protein n=1 Tax=Streptomyces sp. NPDC093261 TaxID=3366037 RepID=UPI00381F1CF3
MTGIGHGLGWASFGLFLCIVAGLASGRLTRRQCSGLLAIAYAVGGLAATLMGQTIGAVFDAALAAFFAHDWWQRGGGGGTRRRLRSLRSKFTGVRRTAPASA